MEMLQMSRRVEGRLIAVHQLLIGRVSLYRLSAYTFFIITFENQMVEKFHGSMVIYISHAFASFFLSFFLSFFPILL